MYTNRLNSQHFNELVSRSGIDNNLANLNFISLAEGACLEYLLISDRIPRNNSGIVSSWWRNHYFDGDKGGWWCNGVDPLNNWHPMEWGCYKPNNPRVDLHGKLIKYEHPPKTPTRIFCLRVPLHIWQQTSKLYSVPMPENIVITELGEALGFWQWAVEQKIPLIICEGAKKAAALLTQGYAALALPGINSGYRVTRNFRGLVISRQLIPELAIFTQLSPTFYICFDYETQPLKIESVNNAQTQLGQLLEEKGCPVKIIRLPGLEKGVDDFIIAKGVTEFQAVYETSVNLETHLAKAKPHTSLTYPRSLELNCRYLGKLPFPTSGLIGVKSAKGTGKTTALKELVQKATSSGQPVLLLTHRIQLGRFLCDRIGINWINYRGEETINPQLNNPQSLGLCIDSIWKLNPEHWQGAVIILDEIEQSLWHLLNSSTCKEKRVLILKIFLSLISIVLQTGGIVIAQDADLSDVSLDYLKELAGIQISPWIVVNEWKPETSDRITFYDSSNPAPLIHQLELDLIAGRKCYITTDSRTGRYSCETIERYIKQRLKQLLNRYPKTLVVSSQTTSTPDGEAVNFIEAINQKVLDYDAVFVTPSLGTGVSIDVEHFDRVYGIFQGVIPDWEARQALARVRPNIPRIVWCAKRGIGAIGSGSKNYKVLSHWYQENQKENLALMRPLHAVDVDLPLVYDLIHLRSWAKLAARVNASITLYRQSMKEGLMAEGYQLNIISDTPPKERLKELRQAILASAPDERTTRNNLVIEIVQVQKEFLQQSKTTKSIKDSIKIICEQIEVSRAEAVANSQDIKPIEYKHLLANHYLTERDRDRVNKYILQQHYGVHVTPQLKQRHDRKYYTQLLTHYYLTHESEYFRFRDKQEWLQQLQRGEGKVFLPDMKAYTLKIEALRVLGMLQFLESSREFKETDTDLIELKNKAIVYNKHIQRAIGIYLPIEMENKSNAGITILRILLETLGLKLKQLKTNNNDIESRIKIYQIDTATLFDGRQEIFEIWQERDELSLKIIDKHCYDQKKGERLAVGLSGLTQNGHM